MQLKSNNLNKVREFLYTILKYSFKQYFEFGSVSPFWIWGKNYLCLGRFNSIGNKWTVDSYTQVDTLSPNIFNLVVDEVVRHWESLLAGETGGTSVRTTRHGRQRKDR